MWKKRDTDHLPQRQQPWYMVWVDITTRLSPPSLSGLFLSLRESSPRAYLVTFIYDKANTAPHPSKPPKSLRLLLWWALLVVLPAGDKMTSWSRDRRAPDIHDWWIISTKHGLAPGGVVWLTDTTGKQPFLPPVHQPELSEQKLPAKQ